MTDNQGLTGQPLQMPASQSLIISHEISASNKSCGLKKLQLFLRCSFYSGTPIRSFNAHYLQGFQMQKLRGRRSAIGWQAGSASFQPIAGRLSPEIAYKKRCR
jgi:hypothetical protein